MSGAARDRRLRLGLVGCGRLAQAGYLPALRRMSRVRLVAVADPDPGRRARVAGLASSDGERVSTHVGAAELIDAAAVDGLVIATPPDAHLRDAALAAEASLPTLV